MSSLLDFHGPNAGYVLELFDRFRTDPSSVDPETRAIFENGWTPPPATPAPATTSPAAPTAAAVAEPTANPAPSTAVDIGKIVAAARLARLVRELGHLSARIDPLGGDPPGDPSLELSYHGLTQSDLEALPASVVGGPLAANAASAAEALERLRRVYSGSIGYEDDHVQVYEERTWLRDAVESGRFFKGFGSDEKRALLERLSEVDTFEQFLDKTPPFQGQKRFSIEGTDLLVPMLDAIIQSAARAGTREVVMGMAHRGRLNVLAHVLGKPYAAILAEFPNPNSPDEKPAVAGTGSQGYSGDVKYHKGYRRDYTEGGLDAMPITLAPNPSHLEFVDPAVVGRARAAQERRDRAGAPARDPKASLPILMHGDAAFPGQGVVAETLNLGQIPGYTVGGTIHIISNNQIGFTTNPKDARSTLYASDLAKGFEVPIVHVNADEPEACIAVARMAYAYRERFGKDFLIDLVGYRRLGHNESEEPAFTQPRMYDIIRKRPRVRELWAKRLESEGVVTAAEAEQMVANVREKLMKARSEGLPPAFFPTGANAGKRDEHAPDARNGHTPGFAADADDQTAVPAERLVELNEALLAFPANFTVNDKLQRLFLKARRTAVETGEGIVWAHAEALALASMLEDGTPIRMTGQDTERGTFTQRHLVLHDPETGQRYCPLQNMTRAKASLALYNSPLSEIAALGFEYGYSVHATNTLVLWEAQFGDFANGAQVIIDQFIVSGQSKWGQSPSVVLLLPHGYEGQGPEHSSGRIERFLQLCAGDNVRVANCTTPAQYFHLLRRQAALLETEPRPLVVMTPKSLLRHPRAVSTLTDLSEGAFHPVLDDPRPADRRENVSRLVLCSGKVYVDLTGTPGYDEAVHIAVARIEELNPFPSSDLTALLSGYPNLREVVWLQEEPQNMGAWTFVQGRIAALLPGGVSLRYIGRAEAASPAEGSGSRHTAEQNRILAATLAAAPSPKIRIAKNVKDSR